MMTSQSNQVEPVDKVNIGSWIVGGSLILLATLILLPPQLADMAIPVLLILLGIAFLIDVASKVGSRTQQSQQVVNVEVEEDKPSFDQIEFGNVSIRPLTWLLHWLIWIIVLGGITFLLVSVGVMTPS